VGRIDGRIERDSAARPGSRISAIIADSSFLSVRDTGSHTISVNLSAPAFLHREFTSAIPVYRVGFDPDDG